jgi:hypothetical protein
MRWHRSSTQTSDEWSLHGQILADRIACLKPEDRTSRIHKCPLPGKEYSAMRTANLVKRGWPVPSLRRCHPPHPSYRQPAASGAGIVQSAPPSRSPSSHSSRSVPRKWPSSRPSAPACGHTAQYGVNIKLRAAIERCVYITGTFASVNGQTAKQGCCTHKIAAVG